MAGALEPDELVMRGGDGAGVRLDQRRPSVGIEAAVEEEHGHAEVGSERRQIQLVHFRHQLSERNIWPRANPYTS